MAKTGQPRTRSRIKITGENSRSRRSGTGVAIKDKIQGCGLIPASRGWGGARNSADRTSLHLTLKQCQDLLAAGDYAERIGLAFNRHWTVHYQLADIGEHEAMRFIGRLLKLAGDYARRHGSRLAAVWVRENGEGKGGHVHILMHLRADLSLVGRTRRWVRLAGGECRAGVSYVRAIGGRLLSAENGGEHYRANADTVRAYLMKAAEQTAGEALGLASFGQAGVIVGKRCGRTQNLGCRAK